MAVWIHPAIKRLQSLARATTLSSRATTAKLPPIARLITAQLLGVAPKFAAHEVVRLPKPKDINPVPSTRHTMPEQVIIPQTRDLPTIVRDEDLRPQIPPRGGPLTGPEAAHILWACCDGDYYRRAPIACIARATGVTRQTCHNVMNGSHEVSEETLVKLSPILRRIASGELAFRRRGGRWEAYRPR